jgi:hypothetical protein
VNNINMQINSQTYEEYFLLYTDGELNASERAQVEQFVKENPELKAELELLAQSVFVADENIIFENKKVLYKEEKKRAIILLGWRKMAAAAAVLILLGAGGWMYLHNDKDPAGTASPEHEIAAVAHPHHAPTENKTDREPLAPATETATINTPIRKRRSITANITPVHTKENKPAPTSIDTDIPAEDLSLPESTHIMHDVATADPSSEKINIAVQARDIAASDIQAKEDDILYAREDDLTGNNKIYFANTSFSKRNNLRVVFRKASRIIDRLTTSQ